MVRLAPTILPCLLGLFVIHFTHASPIPAGLDRRIVTKSPILTELDLASLEGESGINKFFQSRAPADSMKRSGRPDSDSSDITEAGAIFWPFQNETSQFFLRTSQISNVSPN